MGRAQARTSKRVHGVAGFMTLLAASGATAAEYAVERDLVYSEPEGNTLRLDAYLPQVEGPRAAVLVVHGGAWRLGNRRQLSGYAVALARNGMAAFAIDYRLAPTHKFPAQLEDCRSAVRWIRQNAGKYGVDPWRVGAVGYSAGGHLVALLGASEGKITPSAGQAAPADGDARMAAIVAGGAPCDFRELPADLKLLDFWLGGTRAQVPQQYEAASPLAFVSPDDPPMFFYHGAKDALVRPLTPQRMVEALTAHRIEARMHIVEDASHIGAVFDRTALEEGLAFLRKHLGN